MENKGLPPKRSQGRGHECLLDSWVFDYIRIYQTLECYKSLDTLRRMNSTFIATSPTSIAAREGTIYAVVNAKRLSGSEGLEGRTSHVLNTEALTFAFMVSPEVYELIELLPGCDSTLSKVQFQIITNHSVSYQPSFASECSKYDLHPAVKNCLEEFNPMTLAMINQMY